VAGEKEFEQKIRKLGTLVNGLDELPDGASRTAARELVQLLMEVHGAGLERMMELAFESGVPGEALIRKLGQDPMVRSLLLLYSLHPDDLETRVLEALENVRPRLRKIDSEVELVSVREGEIQLRIHTSSHSRGSTARNAQSLVEESVYELAPDLTSLIILGSPEETGFVPLENLLKHPFAAHALAAHGAEVDSAD
jgi:hypothetical protein